MKTKQFLMAGAIALGTAMGGLAQAAGDVQADMPQTAVKKSASKHHAKKTAHKKVSHKKTSGVKRAG